jgi:hypothetical protein
VLAALILGTLLIVGVVLAANGTFSSGDGKSGQAAKSVDEIPVTLSAPGGGSAKGRAVFTNTGGRTGQIAFQIAGTGLQPSSKSGASTYTIWLFIDSKHAYPLAPVAVGPDGKLSTTRPIPAIFTTTQTGLAVLARFQTVRLSLTPTKQLAALVSAAVKKQQPLLPYVGRTVLEGSIPGRATSASGNGLSGQGGTGTTPQGTTTGP